MEKEEGAMTPPELKAVIVEWEDASAESGWRSMEGPFTLSNCLTIGWLIHEDAKMVVIAGSFDPANVHVNQIMMIPRGMVVSMKGALE